MLKDQRAEIKDLKFRLGQGEEAARKGNVWLEVVNFATNESEFVNPFEGRTQARMPKGFISNFTDMKKAAKEAVKTRVALRKTESRVREMEVSQQHHCGRWYRAVWCVLAWTGSCITRVCCGAVFVLDDGWMDDTRPS